MADLRWYRWDAGGVEAYIARRAWSDAEDFFEMCGIVVETMPSRFACTDKPATYAFAIANAMVVVEIDEDPPARAIRVEVTRA